MKIFLVETPGLVDNDALNEIQAKFGHAKIELFEDPRTVLTSVPSYERILVCVSQRFLTGDNLRVIHDIQIHLPRAIVLVIRFTADLLAFRSLLDADEPLLPAVRGDQPFGRGGDVVTLLHPPSDIAYATARLSERETEILLLMRDGLQNKLIARRLTLSVSTVKTHVANIFRKIGASNRLDAICKYADMNRQGERDAARVFRNSVFLNRPMLNPAPALLVKTAA